ncbi:uncharacterized protein LOC131219525 [Magnolia sinica]|uniref:uncharacterized protein LOC131219525 n=1 Tax=Magnolia sinica TaxID=86752 RepID=UPI00265A040A|nr:uncharacterized protein LOC131219525 [Magnolia sinica]
MESPILSSVSISRSSKTLFKGGVSANPNRNLFSRDRRKHLTGNGRLSTGIPAAAEAASAIDPAQAEITWQIVVGALAGITPFVVAGIEFSKRIVAQRRCGVCGGSGLVLRDEDYFRCPGCGGFLPWQSWKRFFSEFWASRNQEGT